MAETAAAEDSRNAPAASSSPPQETKHTEPQYDSPLYTEIQIPLPPLPGTPASQGMPASPETKPRKRSHTLHSFSPFHRRRTSSPTAGGPVPEMPEMPERTSRQEQFVEFSMRAVGKGKKKRSGTIGAAIVPAVMVLSAELFTPAEDDRGRGREMKDRLEVVK